MEVRNFTCLQPLIFESEAIDRSSFTVFVLRGTFTIVPNTRLCFARQQSPLVMADRYYGDPARSSMVCESDLAPHKPRGEVHFEEPIAHAPFGRPASAWEVSIQVGPVHKSLGVTGPRYWRRTKWSPWKLSPPEPCRQVAITYENAFGGWWRSGDDVQICAENPVGVGLYDLRRTAPGEPLPAPRIECPRDPISTLGQRHMPQGFGPIARGWQPRLRLSGTFDDRWLQTKWPGLPDDFDFAHYNSAHPDLIAPSYFRGDEKVVLDGLHPSGRLAFRLPGHGVFLLLRYSDGSMVPLTVNLDTIVLNVTRETCVLIWRQRLALDRPLRVVEIRLLPATT